MHKEDVLVSLAVREQACELLTRALLDERLSQEEFFNRTSAVIEAQTFRELNVVLLDLPAKLMPGKTHDSRAVQVEVEFVGDQPLQPQVNQEFLTEVTTKDATDNSLAHHTRVELAMQDQPSKKIFTFDFLAPLAVFGTIAACMLGFTVESYDASKKNEVREHKVRMANAVALTQINRDFQRIAAEKSGNIKVIDVAKQYNKERHHFVVVNDVPDEPNEVQLDTSKHSASFDSYALRALSPTVGLKIRMDRKFATTLEADSYTDQAVVFTDTYETPIKGITPKTVAQAAKR